MFPIPVLRYMKTYGITHEQIAMVAVVQQQDAVRKLDTAAEWYLQVRQHDPFYRDIEERLRRIGLHGA